MKERILAERSFLEELEEFWNDLKKAAGKEAKMRYWDFVGAETYSETVRRAYLTSFLVTYGYATLKIDPLEEEKFIIPFKRARSFLGKKGVISIPVSISGEEWSRWKEGKEE